MASSSASSSSTTPVPTYHDLPLPSGFNVHYVKSTSSNTSAPTLLLLHGFPSSSNQFRNLIPLLPEYNIIAPDLPAFGLTTYPEDFKPSFEKLTDVLEEFVLTLKLESFGIYIFDYGAPTGLRLALRQPQRVKAIITQNGNAYLEGLGSWWDPVRQYWKTTPGGDEYNRFRGLLSNFERDIKSQYYDGTPDHLKSLIDPLAPLIDYTLSSSTHQKAGYQLDLFYDYQDNLPLYPQFQEWIRENKVPVLAVWGKNDVIFVPPGAEAFKRDSPDARVELLDGGHFLLETHAKEVAGLINEFVRTVKI